MTPQPFSLLLPFYAGDSPTFLARSLQSSVQDQTRCPDEVVLVRDGPVHADLTAVVEAFVEEAPVGTKVVTLEENVGLGRALEAGLAACTFDIVARQDADDVSLPDRFAIEVPVIEAGADIVGSALLEIGDHEQHVLGRRNPPIDPEAIVQAARLRQPFFHPTVVYRREAVRAAGGYQHLASLEDYWLFARMIDSGAKVANVPDALVLYRVGAGAYARRGGWQLLRSEVALQGRLRRAGFISTGQYLRNILVRGGYRLVPVALREAAYRRVFTTKPKVRSDRSP